MKPTDHRILFNGDCNFLFANDYRAPADRDGPYTGEVFDDYVDLLADSGVDAFLINVNGQVPWYPSKVVPTMLAGYSRGDRDFVRPHYPPLDATFSQEQLDGCLDTTTAMLDRYLDLADQGVDLVARMSAACRRRSISPWVSVRMNDAHGSNSWEGSFFNCAAQKDPALRLRGTRLDPRQGIDPSATVCNFEHREVRDYYFTMIQELVEDYDFDGLELDWLRMPWCCEPPASPEVIQTMIDWHSEVRDLTRKVADRRGKPFFLGLRVPSRLGALRTVGLDVAAMARQGIVDFVGFSNFWQTTWDVPYDSLRAELGDGVSIYGVVEAGPNWMFAQAPTGEQGYRLLSTSEELIRGNAAGKLAMGVDGIEFFNFFAGDSEGVHGSATPGSAKYSAIQGVADLGLLRGQMKHYTLATGSNFWSPRFFERADQLPAFVEPGGWRRLRLSMCAEPQDAGLELVAQIVVQRGDNTDDNGPALGISLNGSWPTFVGEPTRELLVPTGAYTQHVAQHDAWNYRLRIEDVRDGWNEFTIYHTEDESDPRPDIATGDPVKIVGLDLAIRR